jgi:hypothetical protein
VATQRSPGCDEYADAATLIIGGRVLAEPVQPNVYRVAAPFEGDGLVNCYLIDAPRRALIDTGTSSVPSRYLLPALAELGWEKTDLRVIINTHMHIDHAGGNAEMQEASGAGIHMHRADWALTDRQAQPTCACSTTTRRFPSVRRSCCSCWGVSGVSSERSTTATRSTWATTCD